MKRRQVLLLLVHRGRVNWLEVLLDEQLTPPAIFASCSGVNSLPLLSLI